MNEIETPRNYPPQGIAIVDRYADAEPTTKEILDEAQIRARRIEKYVRALELCGYVADKNGYSIRITLPLESVLVE